MSDKKVRVVLELDGKQYSAELQTAARDTQAFTQGLAAGARNASGQVDVLTSGINRLTQGMAGLAVGAVGAISAREFIQAADAVTTLNNQLKLATGSTQAAGKAYEALFDIAQRSRVSFTELGGTFASISRAGQELGISQARLLAVTESIGNAMTISGGSAEGMKAALMQLSQGLASGTLQGEELNSVMEQAPRLAKALADGMGIPIGKLREMGAAGQITAQQVISALESQSAVLRGEVSGAVMTVGQAFTQLQNASVKAVGDFDKASGASKTLAEAISGLSGAVGTVGKAFKDNETAITTTLGVLGGAGVAAGLARTGTALVGVATGIGGVSGAVTVLKGVVAGLNPITLGLLGLGAVVGGVSAYNAAHANDIDRMASKLKELEAIQARGGRTIDGGESTAAQVKERVAEIERLRTAIAAFNEEKARANIIPSGGSAERELAAANRKAAESYDELKIRLSGFKGDYAKYAADLKQIQEGMANGHIGQAEGIAMLTELAKKHGEVAKAAGARKPYEDQLAASAQSYGEAMKKLIGNSIDAEAVAAGYTNTQKALLEIFASPGFASMPDVWKQAIVAQAEGVITAEQLAAANKTLAASEADAAKAETDRIDAARKGAGGAVTKLQALKDEEAALVIVAAQHISLAQAIEQVAITRLREQQAALMREGDRDSEVLAIQSEIEARKKLMDALGGKAVREAAEKGATATAEAFQRRTEQIEQSLTDAVMRGGKNGKEYLEGLFRTTAFRVVLDPIMKPLSGMLSGAVNTVIGGSGSSALSTAGNAASVYNAGSAIIGGGFGAVGGSLGAANLIGAAGGDAMGALIGANAANWGVSAAGSAMSQVMSVAFDPITLGIGALVAVLASMDDSGTYHTGGGATYSAATGAQQASVGFALDPRDISTATVDAAKSLTQTIVTMLDTTAKTFGQSGGYTASTAFARDSSADGEWGALRIALGGKTLLDWADTQTSRWAPKEFADGDAGAAQYASAVAASIRDVLITQTPAWADTMLNALGDAPALDQLGTVVNQINAAANALDVMGQASAAFAGLTETTTAALITAMGGASAATSSMSAYYADYYSESERTAIYTAQLTGKFAELGRALPASRDELKAWVDAAVAAGDADLAAKLISLAPALTTIRTAAADAATAAKSQSDMQSAAASALERAADRQRDVIQRNIDGWQTLVTEVGGVADWLSNTVADVRQSALTPAVASAAGQAQLSSMLSVALATGALPDQSGLEQAVSAVRSGINAGGAYGNATDRSFASLALAGQLETLQGVADDQLTSAERALLVDQQQLEVLDQTVAYWKDHLALQQTSIDATLTVEQAITRLQEALKPGSTSAKKDAVSSASQPIISTSNSSMDAYRSSIEGMPDYAAKDWVNVGGRYVNVSGQTMANAEDYYAARLQQAYWSPEADMRSTFEQLSQSNFAGSASALLDIAKAAGLSDNIIASYVKEFFPSYEVGTAYVPNDGPAFLHAGEGVLTRDENRIFRGLGRGQQQGDSGNLAVIFTQLIDRIAALEGVIKAGNAHAKVTADTLSTVRIGNALAMSPAPTVRY